MNLDVDFIMRTATFAISIAAMFYAWFGNRRKDVDGRFRDGAKRMDRHDSRIQALEQSVATMPSKDDIHAIELHMARINGTMSRMEAVMEGSSQIMSRLEKIVTRHEDHLLTGKK